MQLLISLVVAAIGILIAIPAWRNVSVEYALPLVLSGALIGMSIVRAELVLRRRR